MTYSEVAEMFAYKHLPAHLVRVSQPYHDRAIQIYCDYPDSFVRDMALQKLLEAKDAHVRLVAQRGE